MAALQVELVAADRRVWSGDARSVIARTTDGDIGILPGHEPVLGVLVDGIVQITTESTVEIAAVHGGFLSVANNKVSVLAEVAELASEVDVAASRQTIEAMRAMSDLDDEQVAVLRRAETRVRAAEIAR